MMLKNIFHFLKTITLISLFITALDVIFVSFELLSTGWQFSDYLNYAGRSILIDMIFLLITAFSFLFIFYFLAMFFRREFFRKNRMRKGVSFSFAALVIAMIISPINYFFLPFILFTVSIIVNIIILLSVIPLSIMFYYVAGRFSGLSAQWKRPVSFAGFGLGLFLAASPFMFGKSADVSGKVQHFDSKSRSRPNIILITIDTLRADHLSCYGYKKIRTRNIDRFARDGILFSNTFAPSCWTIPSMMSMFTGKYPTVHGCIDYSHAVSKDLLCLAEILKSQGYHTEALISTPVLSHKYGFSRGFDRYLEYGDLERLKIFNDTRLYQFLKRIYNNFLIKLEILIPDTTQWATYYFKEFLNKKPEEPFFLWVHYLDPHGPYRPPQKYIPDAYESRQKSWEYVQKTGSGETFNYNRKNKRTLLNLYDGEILYVDDKLGEIFSLAKERKIYDDALIILTADHGEAFYEHHVLGHAKTLYNEELKIPFIIKLPENQKLSLPKKRIRIPLSLVHLSEIILDLIQVGANDDFSEVNTAEILKGEYRPGGYLFAELARSLPYLKKIREKDFSLIYNFKTNRKELYRAWKDPGESTDVSDQFPEKTAELSKRIDAWKAEEDAEKERYAQGKAVGMTQETLKQLRALGYLQ